MQRLLYQKASYSDVARVGWTLLHYVATRLDLQILDVLHCHHFRGLEDELKDMHGMMPESLFKEYVRNSQH